MAIQAKRGLRDLVAAVVAIAAFLFLLDVRLAHFAGHQQCLDRTRARIRDKKRGERRHAENPHDSKTSTLSSHARSVDVDGDHMHDPGDQQHEEQR